MKLVIKDSLLQSKKESISRFYYQFSVLLSIIGDISVGKSMKILSSLC